MPRPKRSKVTPSIPVQRVPQPAPIASTSQKKDVLSPVSSRRVTNGSDGSDGLVISKMRTVGKSTPMAQMYTMSGALAPEDVGPTRLKPPSARTRATLSRGLRDSDQARAVQEKEKARQVSRPTSIEEPDQIPSSIATKTAEARRPSSSRLGPSFVQESVQARSGLRVQETPRLHSSSMLGCATFKKRPRQPSLLRMAQSQNNTSDGFGDDDMYDFMPDDESTPIIKSLSQTNAQSTSSSSYQLPGSRKRKMRSPEIQVPSSQSLDTGFSPSAVLSPSDHEEQVSEDDNQPQPTLPPPRSTRTPPPQIFSDILAPPESSSPASEVPPQKTRKKPKATTRTKSRSTKVQREKFSIAPSPLSSSSTRISPVHPAALKPLTTATLQNLLPRRRVLGKPKGDYDIPSSSDVELDNTALGEDEDELSFNATKKMRRKRLSMVPPKEKAMAKETRTGGKGKGVSNTYTRKSLVISNEENESESGSDDGVAGRHGSWGTSKTPALDGKAKEEMRRLAEKFREVDEYTLDFEDMTASSDKMKDAR